MITAVGDVIAATSGAPHVFEPIVMLDQPSNLSRYVYIGPRDRRAFPDWDEVADPIAVQLRLDVSPAVEPLIKELTGTVGTAFTDLMTAAWSYRTDAVCYGCGIPSPDRSDSPTKLSISNSPRHTI